MSPQRTTQECHLEDVTAQDILKLASHGEQVFVILISEEIWDESRGGIWELLFHMEYFL